MNPVFRFFVLVTVSYIVWGCEPEDHTLVASQYKGHTLQLIDHTTIRSIGQRSHQAVLQFDGKIVSDYNIGFPLLPEQFPTWIIRNYTPELSNPNQTPWTVYMSPKTFERAEFDQMVACLEAKWMDFDTTLANFKTPCYGRPGRIERLIYGEAPKQMVFRPSRLRYQTSYGRDAKPEETFIIKPDGTWFFLIASNGKGSRFVANAANGSLQVNNGKLCIEKPLVITNEMLSVRPEMAGLSDQDYFQSFADSTGKPLLSVVKYPF